MRKHFLFLATVTFTISAFAAHMEVVSGQPQDAETAAEWQEEYGVKGFKIGGEYGLWNIVTAISETTYWTDIVTEQPEGFYILDNRIYISSAKGLAWLSKNSEDWDFSNHNIVITQDINLSGYLWKPIHEWWGKIFDGNSHIISNMTVVTDGDGGLFESFRGDTIKDIGFRNTYVVGENVGTIAGSLVDAAGTGASIALNCYSTGFVINGNNFNTGGLFGNAGGTLVNCYAIDGHLRGGYYSGADEVGGLAAGVTNIFNCYTSINSFDTFHAWKGLLCGELTNGYAINCFANIDYVKDDWTYPYIGTLFDANDTELGYFFGYPGIINPLRDVAGFTISENNLAYTTPDIALNYQYKDTVDLVTALNKGVKDYNSSLLRTWVWDSIIGMPVYGEYYEVLCPNVTNITATNIPYKDGFAVAVSWQENGSANEWQIKCLPSGIFEEDSAVYFSSYETKDTIIGLTLGKSYDMYVCPKCEFDSLYSYGNPYTFLVDKSYWIDIVTSVPEGYKEDSDGNIIISSAEGLTWMAKCCNWSNMYYKGKTIQIMADIDLGTYKWIPITLFYGNIDGNNHIISNLYANGNNGNDFNYYYYIGLIGTAQNSNISNLIIENAKIVGDCFLGGLVGTTYECVINNCHVRNIDIKGHSYSGGLIGDVSSFGGNSSIFNSSASGIIYGDQMIGGLVGYNTDNSLIQNNFSNTEIKTTGDLRQEFKGGLLGGVPGTIENCYSSGEIEYGFNILGNSIGSGLGLLYPDCIIKNVYSKRHEDIPIVGDCSWGEHNISDTISFTDKGTLDTFVIINETEYTDLLSALNAWVDVNNEDGKYRHWVADTENVNGGFPIFDPNEQIEAVIENAVSSTQKLLRNGQIFILRGEKTYTVTGQEVR